MNLKNLGYILPVLMYYFIESICIGIPVWAVWKFMLSTKFFNFEITYFEWVGIIFIIKAIFYDVFKLLFTLGTTIITQNNENNDNDNTTYDA